MRRGRRLGLRPRQLTAANLGSDPSYDQLWGPAAAVSTEGFYNSPDHPALAEYYEDQSNIPYADSGTCPAYLCGYRRDENGNPKPTSGEIQLWWSNCIAANTEDYCHANDPHTS